MLLYDTSYATISRIHVLASHLGTLDAPCEGRDDGVEPVDGVGGPIPKMEGPLEYMPEQEMLSKNSLRVAE